MVKFHVTKHNKVHINGIPQPIDTIIDVEDDKLPLYKNMGYIEGSSAPLEAPRSVPNIETQPKLGAEKSMEERYAEQTKPGTVKK